jgi:hypothetical protein
MSRKRWACGTLAGIGLLILLGLLPCVETVRDGEGMNRSQSANNLKQIGLALRNYHDMYGRLPPAVV